MYCIVIILNQDDAHIGFEQTNVTKFACSNRFHAMEFLFINCTCESRVEGWHYHTFALCQGNRRPAGNNSGGTAFPCI